MMNNSSSARGGRGVEEYDEEGTTTTAGPAALSPTTTTTTTTGGHAHRGSGGKHLLDPNMALSPASVVSVPEMEMLRGYFASIMEEALLSVDDYLKHTEEGIRGDYNCVGCTACIIGITSSFILCANIGDSGAAFYNNEVIESVSIKHRLTDPKEQERVLLAGYRIDNNRIEGMLAVPRALGDFDFKQSGGRSAREQAVVAVPDVTIRPVPMTTTTAVASAAAVSSGAGMDGDTTEDRWGIILACDGVWDTATLHQVHHALVNTRNDLDVASSATEAAMRARDLVRHHRRGPVRYLDDTPLVTAGAGAGVSSSSPPSSSSSPLRGAERSELGRRSHERSKEGTEDDYDDNEEEEAGSLRRPPRRVSSGLMASLAKAAASAGGCGGDNTVDNEGDDDDDISYVDDLGGDVQASEGIDARLLASAAGVLAQCVAPADNEAGIGLDNVSLILIERRA